MKTLPSGQDPESFDLSRDGKTLYVSNEETAEMSVLDLHTGKVTHRVPVGKEPEGVTVRPDGKVVYVTSEEENEVVAVDTRSLKVLAHIATGPRPRNIAFTRDGKTAFAGSENGALLTVVDVAKNAPDGTIKIEPKAKTVLGPRPMGLVFSPDGKELYVSNGRGESVAVVDVAARKVARLYRRRRRAPVGHRRQPRRQVALHRQRPLGRRLGDRGRDRQDREAHQDRRPALGIGRRAVAVCLPNPQRDRLRL